MFILEIALNLIESSLILMNIAWFMEITFNGKIHSFVRSVRDFSIKKIIKFLLDGSHTLGRSYFYTLR